jgi:hypothetical protein
MTSPFIAYNDGYTFPNLYQETNDMLQACVLVYPMAELRRLAREGMLKDAPHILQLPQTATQVLQAVNTHEHVLLGTGAFDNYFQFDILKKVQKQHDNNSQLVAFDDEFQQHEVVYAICVNPLHKRITVIFRGSTTQTDWATNYQVYMKEIPNPMACHKSQEPTVHVHNGFYEYMFTPTERGATGPNGEALSEYEEILQEHVLPVLQEYPGFKVRLWLVGILVDVFTLFLFSITQHTMPL